MADTKQIADVRGCEFNSETAMAFSVIDSGCFTLLHCGRAVFAVKDCALAFLLGDRFKPNLSFHFERVEKDEFPSICSVLFVDAGADGKFSYDYFFLPESKKDMEILTCLSESKSAEVWLSDRNDLPRVRLAVSLDAGEVERIERADGSAAKRK